MPIQHNCIIGLIAEHQAQIEHLQRISATHPSLFARVIARHKRDIEELKKQLTYTQDNDTTHST